ncbi:sigma-70 family RNA polymerase sigma factor [bacterium]|nr:sigma-70 family RNA polymerase sigma factor [bacterium]RQV94433.1 MAG: sigma-70 family RNA polymerase sigma factor [bacterium]
METQKKASQNAPTDEELINRFQQGDVYAFEQIVHRYKEPLVNFIYHFVGNRIDAEDVVQETFLRVFKKKNLYRSVAKFSTWIYTIASNLAKTELRRRRRRRILSLSQMGYEDKDYELPDHFSSPDKAIERKTKEQTIRKEIEALPAKFKEVVVLRDIQEFSYEEISQILNIPLGTVKSRVNRGRLRLQKHLQHLLDK